MMPAREGLPVFGSVTPFSSGWFRTVGGVSPLGICHAISPRFRSMAVIRPQSGLTIGSACTVGPTLGVPLIEMSVSDGLDLTRPYTAVSVLVAEATYR